MICSIRRRRHMVWRLSDRKSQRTKRSSWLGAHCSWEGGDFEQAAAKLETVLHQEATEDQRKESGYIQRQGEGWFLLGESRRRLKDFDGADAAYLKCISSPPTVRVSPTLLSWSSGRVERPTRRPTRKCLSRI